jgi:hypothetical protein
MRGRLLIFLALCASGCNNPTYLAGYPIELMAGANSAMGLYVLPVRRPTQKEADALVALQQKLMLPQAVPWAQTRDFDIEIEYSIKNLDAKDTIAFAYLDGGNEFGDYVPAAYLNPAVNVNDQAPPPHLVQSEPLTVPTGGMVTGVFREDQLAESALNLEAITRYPSMAGVRATPYIVILHRSDVTSIGRETVPANDITPAHVRYQIAVVSDSHVILDYTVRVRDHNGKLAKPTDMNLYVNPAAMLAPPTHP